VTQRLDVLRMLDDTEGFTEIEGAEGHEDRKLNNSITLMSATDICLP